MATIDGSVLDFRRLDELSSGATPLHCLDPRAKVLVTFCFVVTVVSFGRYEVTALLPFFLFPVALIALGDLPARFIAKKIILVLPFAVLVGILNPLFDRSILIRLGPVGISGGWLSSASITLRAILTVGAALVMVGITGFPAICRALESMGLPRVFATQLMFLYRYIFVLTEEGGRASRARELRSFGKRGTGIGSFGPLVGHLLLRTWFRAERVHMAMLARGFQGEFHTRHRLRFGGRELLFLVGWASFFIILRFHNLSQYLGSFATGLMW